ncbi:MAG: PTS sugar transporter subunit IIC [Lachnospiraceae bacterium]|jgi:PTS system cellobiose-specific IIC component|nr:PTS sugar transporter subunit IIC [Lachnospiraceae bacterium]
MGTYMNEKIIPKIMKLINTKAVQSIKDGMIYSMPLLIVGSVFLILSNFPVQGVVVFLEETGIKAVMDQAYGATFNISAMIAVIGISYNYVKLEGQEPLGGAMVALGTFILLMPSYVMTAGGEMVTGVINKTWTSGQGMIGALIIGLLVGFCYSWFLKKNIRIKMPQGVPAGVSNAFSALIPGAAIILVATVLHGIATLGFQTTVMDAIYDVIQTPLQGMTDSLGGALLMCFAGPFLWVFGVHGSTVVGGIMGGLLRANGLANQAILDSGMELTVANGGHIVTQQFYDQFINVTGAGITIGLVLYMVAFAKSKQLKTLGKLELVPAIFGINEPILFGIPVVMNPLLAVPFVAMPLISCLVQYFALYLGICPLYGAIEVPWTCPPVISGFLVGDWRTALLQIVIFFLSFLVYLPFIRRIDKMNLKQEEEAADGDEDEDW